MIGHDPFANVELLTKRVYAYVAYRIGPGAEAEDVTSATLRTRASLSGELRSEEGRRASWLLGIARRCLAEAPFPRELHLGDSVEEEAASVDLEDGATIRLDVRAAVARLDERQRELVAPSVRRRSHSKTDRGDSGYEDERRRGCASSRAANAAQTPRSTAPRTYAIDYRGTVGSGGSAVAR